MAEAAGEAAMAACTGSKQSERKAAAAAALPFESCNEASHVPSELRLLKITGDLQTASKISQHIINWSLKDSIESGLDSVGGGCPPGSRPGEAKQRQIVFCIF